MTIEGATTTCNIARRGNYGAILSIPHFLTLIYHHSPPLHASLQGFTLYPSFQTGYKYPILTIHEAIVDPIATKNKDKEQPPENLKIKMLYDCDCPLCMREVMGRIHAFLSDGTVVTDVEVFRRLYEQVGLGCVYAITKYQPIGSIADAMYSFWAKYHLQIKGRPPLEEILKASEKKI